MKKYKIAVAGTGYVGLSIARQNVWGDLKVVILTKMRRTIRK